MSYGYPDEYEDADEIANALNAATGSKVSGQDYVNWMEGTGPSTSIDRFHRAAKKFLGPKTLARYEQLARTDDALRFHLNLFNSDSSSVGDAGGVNVKFKLDGLPSLNPKAKAE